MNSDIVPQFSTLKLDSLKNDQVKISFLSSVLVENNIIKTKKKINSKLSFQFIFLTGLTHTQSSL